MMTRKEAFKMAMDIDGHMNDSAQGIDLSWDSIEKLVNGAYAKGAAAEREACAKACEEYARKYVKDDDDSKAQAWMMLQCAAAIRTRGQQ